METILYSMETAVLTGILTILAEKSETKGTQNAEGFDCIPPESLIDAHQIFGLTFLVTTSIDANSSPTAKSIMVGPSPEKYPSA
jgi:hypothetical protein